MDFFVFGFYLVNICLIFFVFILTVSLSERKKGFLVRNGYGMGAAWIFFC